MAKRSSGIPNPEPPQKAPRLSWWAERSCWRYRPTINGKKRNDYVGKGASGPGDAVAHARAVQEAVRLRDRAEADGHLADYAKQVGGGLKHIAEQVEELHAFFQQPYEQTIEELFVQENVPQILRDAVEGEVRKLEVQILQDRVAELEAILAAHGRAALTDSTAPLDELKDKWIESVANEKKCT